MIDKQTEIRSLINRVKPRRIYLPHLSPVFNLIKPTYLCLTAYGLGGVKNNSFSACRLLVNPARGTKAPPTLALFQRKNSFAAP